jgi:hypothetical protein
MPTQKSDDRFSEAETRKRMEAALRGARIAGHKPMSEIAPKRIIDKNAPRKKKPGK